MRVMLFLLLGKRHKTQSTSPTDGQTCRKTLCLFIFDLWLNIHLLSIYVRKMMFGFKFSHSCLLCHVSQVQHEHHIKGFAGFCSITLFPMMIMVWNSKMLNKLRLKTAQSIPEHHIDTLTSRFIWTIQIWRKTSDYND